MADMKNLKILVYKSFCIGNLQYELGHKGGAFGYQIGTTVSKFCKACKIKALTNQGKVILHIRAKEAKGFRVINIEYGMDLSGMDKTYNVSMRGHKNILYLCRKTARTYFRGMGKKFKLYAKVTNAK